MTSIWFVTPAWKRFALSDVCFNQRAQTIEELKRVGVDAHCIVVSDDRNLDIAKSYGFETFTRDNDWLGMRFNDGIEYAYNNGADWVVPVGSDSWVQYQYFVPLPEVDRIRTSYYLCTVTRDRLAHLMIAPNHGGGPYMIGRGLLPKNARPAKDKINRSTDRSIINGIKKPIKWNIRNLDKFQHVSFRGTVHITKYSNLVKKWGSSEHTNNWDLLKTKYDSDLVEDARKAIVLP